MDFSIGNLVSGVIGGIAKIANAVGNALSAVAKSGGILGSFAGAIAGVAAVLANVCEDGEIDEEDEELLEEEFKLMVGALIARFGSEWPENDCDDYSEKIHCRALKNRQDVIQPTSGSKRLDTKDAGYLYGVIEHNDDMGVKTATFYGKREGPSVTVGGRTFGIEGKFKKHGINTKTKNEESAFEIKLAEFETGLNEIEFDNGWGIDTVKVQAEAKVGFEGAEAYAKAALVEGETAKFKIPIPFTDKNLEVGATGDLGSIGGGMGVE